MHTQRRIRKQQHQLARLESLGYCYFDMGGGDSSSAAADPMIGVAAQMSAKTGADALEWAKQQYADTADQRALTEKLANDTAAQQIAQSDYNFGLSKEYADYNKNTYRPLEQSIVDDAVNYDTTANKERLAGQAGADVKTAVASAREAATRQLTGMGVNPNSGAFAAAQANGDIAAAATQAGAQTTARNTAESVGWAKKIDAAALGKGLASNQATSATVGLNAGSAAVGSSGAALGATNAGVGNVQAGFGLAQQGYNSQASALNTQYGTNVQAANASNQANASSSAGLGSLIGGIGSVAAAFV